MAQRERIVAELGRPETPEETAARKAESSRIYRSSQTFRNLIAALVITLGIVAIVIFAVPRGEPAEREPIDVAAVAEEVSLTLDGSTAIVPVVPDTWLVNAATVAGDDPRTWTVLYVPEGDAGFVRVAQGFGADPTWPTRELSGADTAGTTVIDGVEWTEYDIPDPARAGNISAALSTTAGPDTILVYGATTPDALRVIAASLADQIIAADEESS
ncbi:DUF4245 domain-containing protein [Microbacterium schleiferi]|uniref:DUF4245 domain-containing protein n=1 Tax=Microbacterium schleiferi TaxID=69362 RepID=A0A7S8RGY5_9MICO|nr:DUF4245 family protein [Microbacterium schleiferi]QPE03756.1 DUF4245 domain-containing protein [Microbacterium schleiferi]